MALLTNLPDRPLRGTDVARLDEDDRLRVVPYGGITEGAQFRIYAIKVATDQTAHALAFDEDHERWRRLDSVDGADLHAADERLDAVLDDWIRDAYGDRFELYRPA